MKTKRFTVLANAVRRAFSPALALGLLVFGTTAGSVLPAGGAVDAEAGPVSALIKVLEVGRPAACRGLSIVPIYRVDRPKARDFIDFGEAVRNGGIEVTEVEGGRVPQVRISNLSKKIVFLMGGEILTGAKQDRILASDILLAPGTKNLVAPVFCVEHGRWTAVTPAFTTKGNIGTFELRAKAMEKSGGAQSEIWDRVAEQNARVGVASPTGAYQDAYERPENKAQIEEIEKKMSEIPRLMTDTIGVVIGLGGKVVSVDVFADPEMFRAQWPKILRSSALSALSGRADVPLPQTAAADFLKGLAGKSYQAKDGLDMGTEYSCLDAAVNAQALVLDKDVVHLAAFAQAGDKMTDGDGPEHRLRVIRDGNVRSARDGDRNNRRETARDARPADRISR